MNLLPREKLQQLGPANLEDQELLSLILGRGSRKENVFALGQRLLHGFQREELIAEKNPGLFATRFNLTPIQTSQVMASIELGRRLFQVPPTRRQIKTREDAYHLVRSMQYLKKEHVRGLYLNTRARVIHDEIISVGSLDSNIIHPREVFRPAIEYGAYALILVHNHPSGDCSPSQSDKKSTIKLMETAQLLQIPIIDHLIVGEGGYYSFDQDEVYPEK